jgi:membrane protein
MQNEQTHTTKHRFTKHTLGQTIYLTLDFYVQNNLYNYAAACAFGFIFSLIPIVMMTIAILVRILHASPSIINALLAYGKQFKNFFDLESFIMQLLVYHSFNWVDFVLCLFIFWMARKFFATIMQGIARIFHNDAPVRPLINQLIIFAGELILVVIAVVIIVVLFTLHQIFTQPAFSEIRTQVPWLATRFSTIILNLFSYSLIFIFVTIAYRFATGTKPPLKICVICGAICTGLFFIISKLTSIFLNVANYNFIYGILSNAMILLFEMYIFFTLFLTCAQVIYVFQFFDTLLLGELYLLPGRNDIDILSIVRRILFITPDALMRNNNVIEYKADDIIYGKNDNSQDAYYVAAGTVILNRNENLTYYDRGDFFGELTCILDTERNGEAKAATDCKIVRIEAATFRTLLAKNPKTTAKALSQLSNYIAKFYGRTEDFLL